MKSVKGVSFNALRTSDEKLLLEWQTIDPLNRQPTSHKTVHDTFEQLSKQLEKVLIGADILKQDDRR